MASWSDILAALFASHRRRLESFLTRRMGDADTAADLAQEAFLRLARMPDGHAVEDPPKFLFSVAANLARDHHRQAARRPVRDMGTDAEGLACQSPGAERVLSAREDLAVLRDAIAALPPKTREVFLLHRVEGLAYRDIGARLDISPRTVEYHLRKAMAECRLALRGARGDER